MTPRYEDRSHAGRELGERLAPLISRPCVVAGIPRGGVVVAAAIAERLEAPLTVIYACKLTHPTAPDLAFGALIEDGSLLIERECVLRLGLSQEDIERARERVTGEMRHRRAVYHEPGIERQAHGMSVIIVDDGLATGLTMRAAFLSAYRQGAADITVAVPCASAAAAVRLHLEVDGVVCPIMDPEFVSVSQYYADFSAVSDEDVVATLAYARAQRRAGPVGV